MEVNINDLDASFNSLFEMRNLGSNSSTKLSLHAFNSLFEMQELLNAVEAEVVAAAPFNSLFEMPGGLRHRGNYVSGVRFQFSI